MYMGYVMCDSHVLLVIMAYRGYIESLQHSSWDIWSYSHPRAGWPLDDHCCSMYLSSSYFKLLEYVRVCFENVLTLLIPASCILDLQLFQVAWRSLLCCFAGCFDSSDQCFVYLSSTSLQPVCFAECFTKNGIRRTKTEKHIRTTKRQAWQRSQKGFH